MIRWNSKIHKIASSFLLTVIYSYNRYGYIHIYMQNTYWTQQRRAKTSLKKYTSHFIWKFACVRGIWRPKRTAIYWTPTLMAISVVSFLVLLMLNQRPGGPAFCWVLAFSTTTCLQLLCSPKLTDFLSSLSYIIVQSPSQYLWNGMFDGHKAEITVMQFIGHSLSVNQSMTVPWDFTLSHIVQPSSPTRFLLITAIGMYHFLPVHHFGMACVAGSKVNIQHY